MHAFSSDMTNANGSTMISTLETAASEAGTFQQVIAGFRSETVNNLVGPGYNAIRNKMGLYEDALQKIVTISNTLLSNIQAANNMGLNAMCGYSELNTADVPELNARLSTAERILAILKTIVYNEETESYETIGSASSIEAYENIIKELRDLLRVLAELPGKISSARAELSGSETDTGTFSSAVGNISVSNFG